MLVVGSHLSGRNDAELSELAGSFNVLVTFLIPLTQLPTKTS